MCVCGSGGVGRVMHQKRKKKWCSLSLETIKPPPPSSAAFLFQRQNDPSPLLLTLLVLPHPTAPPPRYHHLSASPRCLRCAPTYLASFSFSSHSTTRRVSCQCQLSAARSLRMGEEKKRNPSFRVVCSLPSSCSQLRSLFPLSAGM